MMSFVGTEVALSTAMTRGPVFVYHGISGKAVYHVVTRGKVDSRAIAKAFRKLSNGFVSRASCT